MESSQRAAAHALLVEIPTTAATTSSSDPSVGEGGLQADLNIVMRADTRSQDPKAARILLEMVAAMWEVHRLREIRLPTAARVPGYSEKPVTQNSIESCMFNNRDSDMNAK
jgi:hypothetical protein